MNLKTTVKQFYLIGALWLAGLSSTPAQGLPDFTQLVEENAPAVVNISTVYHGKRGAYRYHIPDDLPPLPEGSPFADLFRRFFEEGPGGALPEETQSLGSGFIISADGYILTNHHVVDGADEIIVRLSDRRSYEAKVIGSDEATDIALIKVEASGLPTAKIGNSNNLKIGAWVLAIGSPFGFDATVTAGIVSAKGRSLPSENYVPYIQTDVAINPGNSGGPLFNLAGEVVGINSQIFSRSGGFMGLSFAVPIELAMNVAEQLRSKGRVSRGYLGVLIQDVDRNLAESFGLDHPKGALVVKVLADSPAAKGGLQVGDIILRYNSEELHSSSQLPPLVGSSPVNQDANLTVLRQGKEIALKIHIAELPPETEPVAEVEKKRTPAADSDRLGLVVEDLNEAQRKELELTGSHGVLVKQVKEGPAAAAGIQPGDIILMVDGRKIESASNFRHMIDAAAKGKTLAVLVHKPQGPVFVALRIPE